MGRSVNREDSTCVTHTHTTLQHRLVTCHEQSRPVQTKKNALDRAIKRLEEGYLPGEAVPPPPPPTP